MVDVLKYFPESISREIDNRINNLYIELEEIRIRAGKPVILKLNSNEIVINYIVNQNEVLEIFQKICENSIYSYQEQICNGYVNLKGGHRVRNCWKCGV